MEARGPALSAPLPADVEHPPIRTYRPRRGRVTATQAEARARVGPTYVLPLAGNDGTVLDLAAVFGRRAPVVLEIGFGMGEATAAMAGAEPGRDVLAVDVHTRGVGALLKRIEAGGLHNVRVVEGDAVDVLRDMITPGALAEVRAFFPDPWPKQRHAKRRLVQPPFVDLVASRLAPAGRFHLATDWAAYARQALAVLGAHPAFENRCAGFAPRPPWRPVTRFEQQGVAAGREIFDVLVHRR